MATRVAALRPDRDGTHPAFIVAGTTVVVALLTFAIYAVGGGYEAEQDGFSGGRIASAATPAPAGACGSGQPNDSYSVAMASDPDPPQPAGTTFRLTVRDGDRVVSGAKVCMAADMPTMQHPGITALTTEGAGGQYETVIRFAMGGSWEAGLTIAEPGKPVVAVKVPFEVAEVLAD